MRFVAVAAAWVVGLFGLSRLPLVQEWLLEPLTRAQQQVAVWHAGGRPAVLVTAECSAADVMALCLAATLAFPVAWKRRLAGAAGGLALILCLNTLRIGTLSAAAGTALFLPLHVYVWPAVLVLATLAYVAAVSTR